MDPINHLDIREKIVENNGICLADAYQFNGSCQLRDLILRTINLLWS